MKKEVVCCYIFAFCAVTACSPSNATSDPPVHRTQEALQTMLFGDDMVRSIDGEPAGSAEAFRYNAVASGNLASVKIFIDTANKAKTIKIGIYADLNGNPGTLLAKGSLTNPLKNTWNNVVLSPQSSIAAGTPYWIAVLGPSGGGYTRFRSADIGAYGAREALQKNLKDVPNTWTTDPNTIWPGWTMSAYALSTDVPPTGGAGGSSGSSGSTGSSGSSGNTSGGQAGAGGNTAGAAGASAGMSGSSGAGAGGETAGASGSGGVSGGTGGNAGQAGSAGNGGSSSGSGGTGTLSVLPSVGCGTTPPQTGDFHLATTDGNGTVRDYEVIVPSTYSNTTPLNLTFVYHGANATQDVSKNWGLQNAAGASSASIFVFPQGISFPPWGIGWDDGCGGRDMPLYDNMLSYLKTHYCIDEHRVFVAGFSWGCDHSIALACCRGSSIRAIGAASCTDEFGNPADYTTYMNLPCPSTPTPAVRFTYDPNGDFGYSAQMFSSTNQLFKALDGCSSSTTLLSDGCLQYQNCSAPFHSCAYPGLTHALPGDWANATWSFFAGF